MELANIKTFEICGLASAVWRIRHSKEIVSDLVIHAEFLADRTNGRAYATVLRLSSSSVTLCTVAKRFAQEQKF